MQRYSRQISLPEIGPAGQEALRRLRVLVVGAGGLGSPAIYYLAAAGVGTIGIVDGDSVDISNLQRQILHTTPRIGAVKTTSAATTVHALNPTVEVVEYPLRLDADNGREIIEGWDFVIDAVDNAPTKYLIDRLCREAGVPYCHGGIEKWRGNISTFMPDARLRFSDIFPPGPVSTEPPVGPIGAVAGVIGTLQALEAIKFATGAGEMLTGRILTFDALTCIFTEFRLAR